MAARGSPKPLVGVRVSGETPKFGLIVITEHSGFASLESGFDFPKVYHIKAHHTNHFVGKLISGTDVSLS